MACDQSLPGGNPLLGRRQIAFDKAMDRDGEMVSVQPGDLGQSELPFAHCGQIAFDQRSRRCGRQRGQMTDKIHQDRSGKQRPCRDRRLQLL